ncbi:MAG: UDP-2,3-diacylglucosamine diphosphatase [Bacteroidia bacterium]|nr:UDP-2,3-diacylglucosamine diphosphatase [Bacteroidia bacterium]
MKRKVEIAVISDVHLGTYGCHARELVHYLKSIDPQTLILNGDIVDVWQFSKSYWPKAHMKVVKQLMGMISKGTRIYYITGNHDEILRRFVGFEMGNFRIVNKVILEINGQKTWFFHGDVFDTSIKTAKWLAKLGGKGYDLLILLNRAINWIYAKMGRGRVSLSKKVKDSVKKAVNYLSDWEQSVVDMAEFHGYELAVCGHIHKPEIKTMEGKKGGQIIYMNSGDWVENCTALEFNQGQWKLVSYWDDIAPGAEPLSDDDLHDQTDQDLFRELVAEFQLGSTVMGVN